MEQIVAAEVVTDPGDLKRPGLLKASLLAYPNTLVRLAGPLSVRARGGRTRVISTVALRPDDAAGFAAAVAMAKRQAADA